AQVRFDLDLPASSNDDQAVGTGIPLPEWDYRKQQLITDYCHLQPLLASQAPACELPPRLRRSAQQ
ncbi:MAG: nitric oxide reductase, partial [Candidatus Competibacteraceae bacterium]|nr:nitric oxide reductase [Candidatus Competibacteraceae bacterium]